MVVFRYTVGAIDNAHQRIVRRIAQELLWMQRAELIQSLELQPRYDLIVNEYKIGFYRADFRYEVAETSTMVVEDVKSPATKTAVYRLKKKLVKALYGKAINEVRIAPKKGYYVIEVVYTKVEKQAELKKEYIAGIDVGLTI